MVAFSGEFVVFVIRSVLIDAIKSLFLDYLIIFEDLLLSIILNVLQKNTKPLKKKFAKLKIKMMNAYSNLN